MASGATAELVLIAIMIVLIASILRDIVHRVAINTIMIAISVGWVASDRVLLFLLLSRSHF
jgi:hypothetical protein